MPETRDLPFKVVLNSNGREFEIPPGRSVLEVLFDAGMKPWHACQTGRCGVCVVVVLEGEAEHRDTYLTAEELAEGRIMAICVSRSPGGRLVLDL